MVHSADDFFELLSNYPIQIDAVELYGSKLLLGCSDGSLKIYAPKSSGSDRPPPPDYHVQAQELRNEPDALERNMSGLEEASGLDASPRVEGASSIAVGIDLNVVQSICRLLSFSISSVWLPIKVPRVLAKISEG
jgi:hypothetical protein